MVINTLLEGWVITDQGADWALIPRWVSLAHLLKGMASSKRDKVLSLRRWQKGGQLLSVHL